MSVTRNEIKKFEEEVCMWLETEGVVLDDINFESHSSMNGYIVCWKSSSVEYVLINKEEWNEYRSDRNDFSRKIDVRLLR
jgi:hypothetical protein